MLKIFKHSAITFVVGLVFIGIGSGIAFAEFSSVEYGGIKTLQTSQQTTTDEYHFTFEEGQQYINIDNYNNYCDDSQNNINVVADESLAKNDIIFLVEHPVDTYAHIDQDESYEDREDGTQIQHFNSKFDIYISNSDFSMFQYTDAFVGDLQENKIYDYRFQINSNVTVKVAPSMLDNVYITN